MDILIEADVQSSEKNYGGIDFRMQSQKTVCVSPSADDSVNSGAKDSPKANDLPKINQNKRMDFNDKKEHNWLWFFHKSLKRVTLADKIQKMFVRNHVFNDNCILDLCVVWAEIDITNQINRNNDNNNNNNNDNDNNDNNNNDNNNNDNIKINANNKNQTFLDDIEITYTKENMNLHFLKLELMNDDNDKDNENDSDNDNKNDNDADNDNDKDDKTQQNNIEFKEMNEQSDFNLCAKNQINQQQTLENKNINPGIKVCMTIICNNHFLC